MLAPAILATKLSGGLATGRAPCANAVDDIKNKANAKHATAVNWNTFFMVSFRGFY
jgi:hypothetical protein